MNFGKAVLGFAVVVPMLLAACSSATPDESVGSEDDALKAAPGCQPPQPGGKCVAVDVTLPSGACIGKLDIYAKAEATCKVTGQTLRDFAAVGTCPGGVTGAKFQCCSEAPPPPPPPRKCFDGGFAGDSPAGSPCSDPKELASTVDAICKKQGYVVNTFAVGKACTTGGYDGATYECCEPKDPPPPPPPPRKCFDGGFANGSGPGAPACSDSATLAKEVTAICARSGYDVNTFSVGAACPGGGWNGASFECCEPKDAPPPLPAPPAPVPPKN